MYTNNEFYKTSFVIYVGRRFGYIDILFAGRPRKVTTNQVVHIDNIATGTKLIIIISQCLFFNLTPIYFKYFYHFVLQYLSGQSRSLISKTTPILRPLLPRLPNTHTSLSNNSSIRTPSTSQLTCGIVLYYTFELA